MDRYMNSHSFNMVHLCINEYNGYNISGEAYNNTIKNRIVFSDIKDLILKIDMIFDNNGNPISSKEKRSFKEKPSKSHSYQNKPIILNDYKEFLDNNGKLGSIDIIVITRLFSNWQGIIFYNGKQENFSDVVEMIDKVICFLKL